MHLEQETVGFCGNNVQRWSCRRKAVHNDVTGIRHSLVLFSFIRAIIIDSSHEKGAAETRLVIDTFCKTQTTPGPDAWASICVKYLGKVIEIFKNEQRKGG